MTYVRHAPGAWTRELRVVIDDAKKRIFAARGSDDEPDRYKTIIDQSNAREVIENTFTTRSLHYMHSIEGVMGRVLDFTYDSHGFDFRAEVGEGFDVLYVPQGFASVPILEPVDNIWRKMEAGYLRGASIRFNADEEEIKDNPRATVRLKLNDIQELSVVGVPGQAKGVGQVERGFDRACPVCAAAAAQQAAAGSDPSVQAALAALRGRVTSQQSDDALLALIAEEMKR